MNFFSIRLARDQASCMILREVPKNQILDLFPIGQHVRRAQMGFQGIEAAPFFDQYDRVGIEDLARHTRVQIHRRPVFDASRFGRDRRHVGLENIQKLRHGPRLHADGGNDMNHDLLLPFPKNKSPLKLVTWKLSGVPSSPVRDIRSTARDR